METNPQDENLESGTSEVQAVVAPGDTIEPSTKPVNPEKSESPDDRQQGPQFSRRSILWAAAYLGAVYGGVKWFASRAEVGGTPWPFRRSLELNEGIWGDAFDPDRPVRTFPKSAITASRENGDEGLSDDFDPDQWQLTVAGVHGHDDPITLTMADIRKLPTFEMTTEFFCIEGWSVIQHWKGVRMRDFMRRYPPATTSGDAPDVDRKPKDLPPYVGMMTPDGGYFVGLDMPSARHIQTMLAFEMNGEPLTLEHGAPLRLVIPVKYGVKNIKRIGTITYAEQRPRDFWAEQGYDWFAGV